MPFLTTTLDAELGNNTSANPAYAKVNFPANFTGTTQINISGGTEPVDSAKYDDSWNPVTPVHVSPRKVKDDLPGFTGTVFAHANPWFHLGGGGGHIDNGTNSDSNTYIDAMLQDMHRRGVDSIPIDWYGPANYVNGPTLKIQARIPVLGLPLTYSIQIDHQAYTDTASLQALVNYVVTTFLSDPNYYRVAGVPMVSFFDVVAGVDYAGVKAAAGVPMYWVFENAGSLTNPATSAAADGAFEWVTQYTDGYHVTDPYHLSSQLFFLSTVHSSTKGTIPCLNRGFNGTLTLLHEGGYAAGRMVPSDSGKNWLTRMANFLANIPTHCLGVQLVTWQDYEEGTELETGIQNDLILNTNITGSVLNFSVTGGTGDESTLYSYKILASPDSINAAVLGEILIGGGHSFNLGAVVGWNPPADPYQIYVVAVGKAMFRNQSVLAGVYTPTPFVPPPVIPSQPTAQTAAVIVPSTENPMSLNSPSFRLPFTLPNEVHPAVKDALRLTFQGLADVNQAITVLHKNVGANTQSITNVTNNITETSSGGGSSGNVAGAVNDESGATVYALQQSDYGALVVLNAASPITLSLNSAVSTPFYTIVSNTGTSDVTAIPTTGAINGDPVIPKAQYALVFFDGTNWWMTRVILARTSLAVLSQWINSYDETTGIFTTQQPSAHDLADSTTGSGHVVLDSGATVINETMTGITKIISLTAFPNNAAALVGGIPVGGVYRSGGDPDLLAVVH